MNRTSFAQELRHRVKATKTRRRESHANRDVVHTYIPFLSAINIDLIYSTFGSRITNEKTKRASYVQEFCHCVGPQKLTSGNGRSRLTMTLLTQMAFFFRLSIQTSSIVYLGVGAHMSQTKRAPFVKEFCHCVEVTKRTSGMATVGRP
jgi:hypothetical protein